jgi:N-acetylglucosaminyldiphosphoundecaprenol N-acetyl-beta-D-mannosaminyltransferase
VKEQEILPANASDGLRRKNRFAVWRCSLESCALLTILSVHSQRKLSNKQSAIVRHAAGPMPHSAIMEHAMPRNCQTVLGARIDALSWEEAIGKMVGWAAARESRYVCICNVHSVVTTTRDPAFKTVVNGADMSTPDGAPVAWALRRFGFRSQQRINGPDLMWRYLAEAERLGQSVFFYGSTAQTLQKLRASALQRFPALQIVGQYAPPFRALSAAEDAAEVEMINRSGAQAVFVGLGCPKQEKWMAAHRDRVKAVMIGVGAAFDYHSGTVRRAPLWWQQNGLEWLYRLASDPQRLLKRYLVTNTLFIIGLCGQLISTKIFNK